MKANILFNSILAIASSNPAGYTVGLNLEPVTTGYAVAVKATQNSFGEAGLRRVIDYVTKNAPAVNAFGGWLDTESGLFYFDATIVVPTLEEAEKLARENDQLAFFCLDTCTEIRCK